jgi:hypothetical protein
MIGPIKTKGPIMATHSAALQKSASAYDTFYVVKQFSLAFHSETVTVLHQVPTGAEELASFRDPNEAIDFAEATVRQQRAIGSLVELVDPPHGLVGAG